MIYAQITYEGVTAYFGWGIAHGPSVESEFVSYDPNGILEVDAFEESLQGGVFYINDVGITLNKESLKRVGFPMAKDLYVKIFYSESRELLVDGIAIYQGKQGRYGSLYQLESIDDRTKLLKPCRDLESSAISATVISFEKNSIYVGSITEGFILEEFIGRTILVGEDSFKVIEADSSESTLFVEEEISTLEATTLTTADRFYPVIFGEVEHFEPLVLDDVNLKYFIPSGANVSSVFDNGVPVLFTHEPTENFFTLHAQPQGVVTASASTFAVVQDRRERPVVEILEVINTTTNGFTIKARVTKAGKDENGVSFDNYNVGFAIRGNSIGYFVPEVISTASLGEVFTTTYTTLVSGAYYEIKAYCEGVQNGKSYEGINDYSSIFDVQTLGLNFYGNHTFKQSTTPVDGDQDINGTACYYSPSENQEAFKIGDLWLQTNESGEVVLKLYYTGEVWSDENSGVFDSIVDANQKINENREHLEFAHELISDITADDKVTFNEKLSLQNLLRGYQSEENSLINEASMYSVTTADYTSKLNALENYLLNSVAIESSETIDIDRSEFNRTFNDFFTAKSTLLNSVSAALKKKIDDNYSSLNTQITNSENSLNQTINSNYTTLTNSISNTEDSLTQKINQRAINKTTYGSESDKLAYYKNGSIGAFNKTLGDILHKDSELNGENIVEGSVDAGSVFGGQLHGVCARFDDREGKAWQYGPNTWALTVHGQGGGIHSEGGNHGVVGKSSSGVGVLGNGATYDFYADGTVSTNFGPFTGGHDILINKTDTVSIGDIVSVKEVKFKTGWSQTLPTVSFTNSAKDPAVYGVCVKYPTTNFDAKDLASLGDEAFDLSSYKYSIVNALGEGVIAVCDEGGDIACGDYICSSSLKGKGMRQDDDLLHNYTVAKALEEVLWEEVEEDENGIKVRMIACTYHCG